MRTPKRWSLDPRRQAWDLEAQPAQPLLPPGLDVPCKTAPHTGGDMAPPVIEPNQDKTFFKS